MREAGATNRRKLLLRFGQFCEKWGKKSAANYSIKAGAP